MPDFILKIYPKIHPKETLLEVQEKIEEFLAKQSNFEQKFDWELVMRKNSAKIIYPEAYPNQSNHTNEK